MLKYQHIKQIVLRPGLSFINGAELEMEDYNSETDSDYTSYWRDWVCDFLIQSSLSFPPPTCLFCSSQLSFSYVAGFLCTITSHTE